MGETADGQLVERPRDPEDEIARIQASIELTREQIVKSLEDVQENVQDSLDWKEWVKRHPWETVGVAFAIGFLIGRS